MSLLLRCRRGIGFFSCDADFLKHSAPIERIGCDLHVLTARGCGSRRTGCLRREIDRQRAGFPRAKRGLRSAVVGARLALGKINGITHRLKLEFDDVATFPPAHFYLAVTVKLCVMVGAIAYCAFPDCSASSVHLPAASREAVLPETVHTVGVVER